MNCQKCGSSAITYYRQKRVDGEWVVTARCGNGHHPIHGKPFYPKWQFDVMSLPVLGQTETKQAELFTVTEKTRDRRDPYEGLDPIERKRMIWSKHP